MKDKATPALAVVLLALVEVYRSWAPAGVSPWVVGAVGSLVVSYSVWGMMRLRPQLQDLKLARDGERKVAGALEELRSCRYRVYHDVQGPGFNLDHVIVGPAGIFTIETKTRRKPARGKHKVIFDGSVLHIGPHPPADEDLIQARAQARWLAALLNRGRPGAFKVRPVIVFPGWYVESVGAGRHGDIWVLNPLCLEPFLKQEPEVLSPADIGAVAHSLDHCCRYPPEGRANRG